MSPRVAWFLGDQNSCACVSKVCWSRSLLTSSSWRVWHSLRHRLTSTLFMAFFSLARMVESALRQCCNSQIPPSPTSAFFGVFQGELRSKTPRKLAALLRSRNVDAKLREGMDLMPGLLPLPPFFTSSNGCTVNNGISCPGMAGSDTCKRLEAF